MSTDQNAAVATAASILREIKWLVKDTIASLKESCRIAKYRIQDLFPSPTARIFSVNTKIWGHEAAVSGAFARIRAHQLAWRREQERKFNELPEVRMRSMDDTDRWGTINGDVQVYTVLHYDPTIKDGRTFLSQVYFDRGAMQWCNPISDLRLSDDDIIGRLEFRADIDKFLNPNRCPSPQTPCCDVDEYSELMVKKYKDDYPEYTH
jgi:hypothetical protein